MGILQITTDLSGQTGIVPRLLHMLTTDTISTITTAGYLNANAAGLGYAFAPSDVMIAAYSDGNGGTDTGLFSLSFGAAGAITLETDSSTIVLPTITNHIATYINTSGGLSEDPATAISGGNIQAGLSGTAGSLSSFPATQSKGHLAVTAVANTGNTVTTISNVAMGQASVVSIPDPANAVGRFLIGATATPFTTGHLIASSGTGGLTVDSGVPTTSVQLKTNIKAAQTANIGGSGAGPLNVTVAGLTSSSVVVGTLISSSNAVEVQTIAPGSGSFDVTFTGDPGASAIMSYVAFIAAQ